MSMLINAIHTEQNVKPANINLILGPVRLKHFNQSVAHFINIKRKNVFAIGYDSITHAFSIFKKVTTCQNVHRIKIQLNIFFII